PMPNPNNEALQQVLEKQNKKKLMNIYPKLVEKTLYTKPFLKKLTKDEIRSD
ncbi:39982_t:CDS:1, partial [Gigaspora margarita]